MCVHTHIQTQRGKKVCEPVIIHSIVTCSIVWDTCVLRCLGWMDAEPCLANRGAEESSWPEPTLVKEDVKQPAKKRWEPSSASAKTEGSAGFTTTEGLGSGSLAFGKENYQGHWPHREFAGPLCKHDTSRQQFWSIKCIKGLKRLNECKLFFTSDFYHLGNLLTKSHLNSASETLGLPPKF